jgi:hypothetical protein
MNDLDEFAEIALAIFVALTLLIWLLTYLERRMTEPAAQKRTRRGHPTTIATAIRPPSPTTTIPASQPSPVRLADITKPSISARAPA